MDRAELAARLVEADEPQRNALLQDQRAALDVQLAHILKDICLDGWSSNPLRSLAASATLRTISQLQTDPELTALCHWTQGIEALIKGDMNGAIATLDEARQVFLGLDKPHAAAATEVSKVIALAMLGLYEEAIACALRARRVFLDDGDLLATGKIEHNIGNLYFRRDQYLEAEEFHTSARVRFIAVNHEKQLATINNCLANTHAVLHKFSSAAALYEEAVALAERAGVPVTQAEIEGNIGNFALLRGRYDQALDYLERSRRRYEFLGMPHQSALAEREIADAYLELNLVPEAAAIYARVTETFASLGLRADEARALASRGRAELLSGNDKAALAALKRARELYRAEGNKVGEALVLVTQAQLHHAHGNDEIAHELAVQAESDLPGWHQILLARWLRADIARTLNHTDEAQQLFESVVHDSINHGQPQITERSYTGLGLVANAKGETAVAQRHFRNAIAVTEELRAPLPGEEFKTAFFANKLAPYSELVRICLEAGDERLSEALTLVESARSRALVDSLGGGHDLVEPRDAFEANLLTQIGELREELNYLYKEINQPVNGHAQRRREVQQELRERENKVLEITRQLHHRREGSASPLGSFDVGRLQQQLRENDALVEYATLGEELLAFVVTRDNVRVARNLTSLTSIKEHLNGLRFQIETLRYGASAIRRHLPTLTKKINVHLRHLYEQLIHPLKLILEQRNLIVVPYGALHYLPFHALYDGDKYLIEHCEISYAPSAAILQQCLERGQHNLNRALLMGVSDEQTPRISNEIQSLSEVFPAAKALVGEAATSEALRQNSGTADVVHLACHGQFRSDNPLFSALRLADGWLTVRDAYSLKLDRALVTLSACETGANVIAPGDELIGLARGFFSAGARSVLLSLWMVDDEATEQMMVDFYRETMSGRTLSAALRAAQLKMLEEKPHPFFWSPFVLVGHW
ncbi:MAG TPA: CHAT domain-containing tetratricopeptide repeat protein [Pyrinomonadaceae bacterium]|nr:CHAT domain-containing tetratricopeptide repeat protein [Pyrinomonadaceae bacterium]